MTGRRTRLEDAVDELPDQDQQPEPEQPSGEDNEETEQVVP